MFRASSSWLQPVEFMMTLFRLLHTSMMQRPMGKWQRVINLLYDKDTVIVKMVGHSIAETTKGDSKAIGIIGGSPRPSQ